MLLKIVLILRTVACVIDILLALALSLFALTFVRFSEGGREVAPVMLAIVWGYAIPNFCALISKSRLWRILWSVPAVLGNLGALWLAGRLLFELAEPLPMVAGQYLLILVFLNVPGIFLRPPPMTRNAMQESV